MASITSLVNYFYAFVQESTVPPSNLIDRRNEIYQVDNNGGLEFRSALPTVNIDDLSWRIM